MPRCMVHTNMNTQQSSSDCGLMREWIQLLTTTTQFDEHVIMRTHLPPGRQYQSQAGVQQVCAAPHSSPAFHQRIDCRWPGPFRMNRLRLHQCSIRMWRKWSVGCLLAGPRRHLPHRLGAPAETAMWRVDGYSWKLLSCNRGSEVVVLVSSC
jgi:hypothetical protein